jgi:hypothetical protein
MNFLLYRTGSLLTPELSGVDSRSKFSKYFKNMRIRMNVGVFCANFPNSVLNSQRPSVLSFLKNKSPLK